MTIAEEWRPVVGREGEYEVSSLGRVRSLDRVIWRRFGRRGPYADMLIKKTLPGVLLKPQRDTAGYPRVSLRGRPRRISSIVAEAFIGPRPDGAMVLHRNDEKSDNRAENLRYGDGLDNAADALRNGRTPTGSRHYSTHLCDDAAAAIAGLRYVWSQSTLAMLFDVSPSCVQSIQERRTWKHVTPLNAHQAAEWIYYFGPLDMAAAQIERDRRELIWGPTALEDQWNAQRELDRRAA